MKIFKLLGSAALAGTGFAAGITPAVAQEQQNCVYVLQGQNAPIAAQGATGTNSLSCGFLSRSQAPDSTAYGNGALTFVEDTNSVAIGNNSRSDGANTFGVGGAGVDRRIVHVADGVNATDAATVGQLEAFASDVAGLAEDALTAAEDAQDSADNAQDTADTALDVANQASDAAGAAQDTADTALTNAATAQTTADQALANTTYFAANADGPVPTATGANAVAIGPGAAAARDGQIALGGTAATYTLAGLASDASRAAQQGAVSLVTTDMAGNLATADLDLAELQGLGGRVDALEGQVVALTGTIGQGFRRANAGIAAAMALGGTVMPPDSRFAVSFNIATYRGQQGFSGAVVARVTDHVWVSGGFAGSTVRGSTGGRAGVTFGW